MSFGLAFKSQITSWLLELNLGKSNTLATWCEERTLLKRPWCWERLKAEKGMTEDEMVGWQHWLNGHEFEQALGVGDGQGGLACCSPWGRKESDMTEWLNWSYLTSQFIICKMGILHRARQVKWLVGGLAQDVFNNMLSIIIIFKLTLTILL